jgi:hypothetical protein
MASNPRMVIAPVTITWDGVAQPVAPGTVVDIPAGGALEAAYGSSNLAQLSAQETTGGDVGEFEPTGGEEEGGST